jgi:hypothetical protein
MAYQARDQAIQAAQSQTREMYASMGVESSHPGNTIDIDAIGNLPMFASANIRNVNVDVYSNEGETKETRSGQFTSSTHPIQEADTRMVAAATNALNSDSVTGYPADSDILFFTENLTKYGYTYKEKWASVAVTKLWVTDRMALTPKQLAAAGLSWSPVEPLTLIGQNTITAYAFIDPATSTEVDVLVSQPTTPTGDPIGKRNVCVAPKTEGAALTHSWRTYVGAVGAGLGAGFVYGVGVYVALAKFGGAAAATTGAIEMGAVATETTALISSGGTAAAGLSATGIGALVVVGILVVVGMTLLILWLSGCFDTINAYFNIVSGSSIRTNNDGTVVFKDGTVRFEAEPHPSALPNTGSQWIGATRTTAITEDGKLWFFNTDSKAWENYLSDHTYNAVSVSRSWVGTVSKDKTGKTYLEIPEGPNQPDPNSDIGKGIAALNEGKDPLHGDAVINPPIPGWKEFKPGTDYGIAMTTDGRAYGVGNNKDGQCDLPNRYTKIVTAVDPGNFNDCRYSLGIRSDNGAIDFAGDDPSSIKDDIETAKLNNVRDIAAGPDRAIAITNDGGAWTFGENGNWHPVYKNPRNSLTGQYIAISVAQLNDDQFTFVASKNPTSPPTIAWQEPFGGSSVDSGRYIVRTADNGFIISGTTSSADGDLIGSTFHGNRDIFIAKYSANKEREWMRTLGGSDGLSDVQHITILRDGYTDIRIHICHKG